MTGSLLIAGLLLLGFLCQWLAWRVKLPAILFLLIAGIILGPVLGWLAPSYAFYPERVLGNLLFPFVSLGVAVILFEGSLTLRFSEIRGLAPTILRLVSVGAAIAFFGLAAAAHYLAGLDWPLALLFGALTCVTGPTVIVPLIRSVRPNARIANVLRWEGIIIDPIGALLAVLVFEALALGHGDHGVQVFFITIAYGSVIGAVAAFLLARLLRRHLVPEYLQNYATLALLLLAFALSNTLAEESGLLAVTVMGMVLANQRDLQMEDILDFKEHLSTLLISLLFIVLAARLSVPSPSMMLAGFLLLLVAMLVIRPLSVVASTLGSNLTWRERALLAWVAPRGIVAAAVSALFALKLEENGVPGAEALVPLTFLLIIGTVVINSATSRRLATWLGVAEPDPRGVLLVGASRISLLLGESFAKQGYDVLVADDDWSGVRAARMAGLRTYYGDPASEHADRNLDLIGLGRLLAMSTRRELNTLSCVRYRPEFGKDRVYFLRNASPESGNGKRDFSQTLQAPRLFGADITHEEMNRRLDLGWVLKQTRITEEFSFENFLDQFSEKPLPLFAITDRGRLRIATATDKLEPKAGWTLTSLVNPASRHEPASSPGAKVPAIEPTNEPNLPG
ncbi:MAG: cation:proton antiporter [Dokdonella sp.]